MIILLQVLFNSAIIKELSDADIFKCEIVLMQVIVSVLTKFKNEMIILI